MEEVYPYLFRTEPYSLFAFGSFKVSAYLLLRPEGNIVANHFGIPFCSPQFESHETSKLCSVDKTYSGDLQYDNTFEIISTPGHTVGSSCFIWTAPDEKRILFTGDNLYPSGGESWDGFALQKKDPRSEI